MHRVFLLLLRARNVQVVQAHLSFRGDDSSVSSLRLHAQTLRHLLLTPVHLIPNHHRVRHSTLERIHDAHSPVITHHGDEIAPRTRLHITRVLRRLRELHGVRQSPGLEVPHEEAR